MSLEADFNDISKESTKINFNVELQQLSAITEPTIENLYKILLAALKQSINLKKTASVVLDELKDVKLEVNYQKEDLRSQKNLVTAMKGEINRSTSKKLTLTLS